MAGLKKISKKRGGNAAFTKNVTSVQSLAREQRAGLSHRKHTHTRSYCTARHNALSDHRPKTRTGQCHESCHYKHRRSLHQVSPASVTDAMFERDFIRDSLAERFNRGSKRYFPDVVVRGMPERIHIQDPLRDQKKTRTSSPYAMPAAGGLAQLRSLLAARNQEGTDTTLVAIDTETESHAQHVVEVGITTISTHDIAGIEPGENLVDWMPKMKHYHFVLEHTYRPAKRTSTSIFTKSQYVSTYELRAAIRDIWRVINDEPAEEELPSLPRSSSCQQYTPFPHLHQPATPEETRTFFTASTPPRRGRIALIGHNLSHELHALEKLRIPIRHNQASRLQFDHHFDTHALAGAAAAESGARFAAFSLGSIARSLGVDPRFHSANAFLHGLHNASNDAAYTMMAALQLATRPDLSQVVPESGSAKRPRKRRFEVPAELREQLAADLGPEPLVEAAREIMMKEASVEKSPILEPEVRVDRKSVNDQPESWATLLMRLMFGRGV